MPILVWVIPAIIAILALPTALGMIQPNRWYGLRTAKTLSSPDNWYAANRFSGWVLVAANGLVICFNLVLLWLHPHWERDTLLLGEVTALVVALLLGLAASLLYLLIRSSHTAARIAIAKERFPSQVSCMRDLDRPGFELAYLVVLHGVLHLDRMAADFAVLDVGLSFD
jgi:uncharacterized membrane protein